MRKPSRSKNSRSSFWRTPSKDRDCLSQAIQRITPLCSNRPKLRRYDNSSIFPSERNFQDFLSTVKKPSILGKDSKKGDGSTRRKQGLRVLPLRYPLHL